MRFQLAILHRDVTVRLTRRVSHALSAAASHWSLVPRRAYPSTVLMTVVPAQAAGVEQMAIVAPPTPFGSYNQDLLATCHELGVTEVYRMGGAQAVAAFAYGVEGLERVDKIVGPGNLFVALAKKYVFGEVGIDSIAGPSEVIVISNGTGRADFVAAAEL
jgi:histidinol dehydrogenase